MISERLTVRCQAHAIQCRILGGRGQRWTLLLPAAGNEMFRRGAKLHQTTWGSCRPCQPGRTPSTAASGAPASRPPSRDRPAHVWRAAAPAAAHRCALGIQSPCCAARACTRLHWEELKLKLKMIQGIKYWRQYRDPDPTGHGQCSQCRPAIMFR